jgi:uncharacterized protein YecE (DUF72 family)
VAGSVSTGARRAFARRNPDLSGRKTTGRPAGLLAGKPAALCARGASASGRPAGKVLIGTSGWTYAHWKKVFYPEGMSQREWLLHYCSSFDTVEINATFYRLPKTQVFDSWRERTPPGFLFAVKCGRRITHWQKLEGVEALWEEFWSRLSRLEGKLGIVLFQFHPKWEIDTKRLANFLPLLPPGARTAFEFRHKSWFCEETYELLRKYDAAMCRASSPGFPDVDVVTARHCYLRMHGGTSLYASKYTDEELAEWAAVVKGYVRRGLDCYVYFNNDAHGYAVENALTLRKLVEPKFRRSAPVFRKAP